MQMQVTKMNDSMEMGTNALICQDTKLLEGFWLEPCKKRGFRVVLPLAQTTAMIKVSV